MALGRPGVVTTFQVVGLALTIPLMLVFIPRFGVEGAASSLLISTAFRLLFVTVSFRRLLNVNCPRILAGVADISRMAATLKSLLRPRTGSIAEGVV